MEYNEKLKIANSYIDSIAPGMTWDDLSDINSLHDCEDIVDIHAYCDERFREDGLNLDDEDIQESTDVNDTTPTKFTKEEFTEFKRLYNKAKQDGITEPITSFTYKNIEVLIQYAKYVIEYYDNIYKD